MFHFLKNTTMVPDVMARQACDSDIVISSWNDYNYMYDTETVINHVHTQQKYNTFEQWYSTMFKNDYQFVSWVYQTKDLGFQIYADCDAYAKLVIKWITFISPSLTVEQVYNIYRLSVLWFYVYQVHLHMNTTDQLLAEYGTVVDHYKIMRYQDFQQHYNQLRVEVTDDLTQLKTIAKNYISNEFKYAFYLNGDKSFEPFVLEHVNKALVRCFKMELDQYKYLNLFDVAYDKIVDSVEDVDDQSFDIIKQMSKTLPNDETIEPSVEQLYQYGLKNDKELMQYNNVMIDQYHDIITGNYSLDDKLRFISRIASGGIEKSEFVDVFSSSYMLYNLLILRYVITLWNTKSDQLKNFVY